MGKIFGISDLPVSTIMSPFEGVKVPKPQVITIQKPKYNERYVQVPQTNKVMQNAFVKMKNGFKKIIGR